MKTLAAFLILTVSAWAQPTAVIRGPESVHAGQIVMLDGSGSEATSYTWRVDLSRVNVPEDGKVDLSSFADTLRAQGFEVVEPESDDGEPAYLVLGEKGDRLQLTSYPNSVYVVDMACADEEGVSEIVRHTVTVGKVKPPKPEPDDDDDVTPPEPLGELARLVRDAVRGAGGDAGEWKLLASVYETLGKGFAGSEADPRDVAEATKQASRAVLNENLDEWTEVLGEIGGHLNDLGMETAGDHSAPWQEIAAGIRAGSE